MQASARNSYRLDKCLYEPLTVAIASSFTMLSTYNAEIKKVNKAIETTIKGLNSSAFLSLQSIPGIGPVMAAGIMAEIGDIHIFKSQESLAKYAGLVWHENQSGQFKADDTPMSKAVTPILYIIYWKRPAILESIAPNTGNITLRNTLR